MKTIFTTLLILLLHVVPSHSVTPKELPLAPWTPEVLAMIEEFDQLQLGEVSFLAYKMAIEGHAFYKSQNIVFNDLVIIIDFDLPSDKERLYVVDVNKKKVLHHSLVAHGKNSGDIIPTRFSNRNGSLQSSLGFYKTNETYIGKQGLSLRLDGLERGVNDHARERGIVIHAADYVSREFIKQNNHLGRSFGCPAIPERGFKRALDLMDDQVLLFIYSTKKAYTPAYLK